jgi:predicted nuclease of restriction endonuclease-like (RecB) superfamily
MLKTVSKQTVALYWEIGKSVSQQIQDQGWGKSIVEQLSKDLQREFPGIKGFSARNLWNMKNFYEFYAQNEKLQPLVAEIGWTQNCIILEKCKDIHRIEYYLKKTKQMGWSKLDLIDKIKSPQRIRQTSTKQRSYHKKIIQYKFLIKNCAIVSLGRPFSRLYWFYATCPLSYCLP